MKELNFKSQVMLYSPIRNEELKSNLTLTNELIVTLDNIDDVWDMICSEVGFYAKVYSNIHNHNLIEIRFDINIDIESMSTTLGIPCESPIPLTLYPPIKDLYTRIKLTLYN